MYLAGFTIEIEELYFTFDPASYGSGSYTCYSNYIMGTRPFHGVQWLGHGNDQQPQLSATIY